ncbi:MAG TPA: HAD family hydrolase [Gemmatimonadaceae bacterium]|nr:HAD family hydrolase [Gemmatimonadaceae bacterium]
MPPTVLTLDYWDTIYAAVSVPERVVERRDVVGDLLRALGREIPAEDLARLYHASAVEADRWWREQHRGYSTADRLRWLLAQLAIERPEACEHIARAVDAVDRTMIDYPPALIEGAAEAIRELSRHFRLAVVSDTGFVTGRAQDAILEKDGLRQYFVATVYSMDVGHAKPRPEPFLAALAALGAAPSDAIHIGDIERTDVAGALNVGMRAVRADFMRSSGASAAEYVSTDYRDLVAYLKGSDSI